MDVYVSEYCDKYLIETPAEYIINTSENFQTELKKKNDIAGGEADIVFSQFSYCCRLSEAQKVRVSLILNGSHRE